MMRAGDPHVRRGGDHERRGAAVSLGTVTAFRTLMRMACSGGTFRVLDRAFAHPLPREERAAIPLAGGIMQHGHQRGMLYTLHPRLVDTSPGCRQVTDANDQTEPVIRPAIAADVESMLGQE